MRSHTRDMWHILIDYGNGCMTRITKRENDLVRSGGGRESGKEITMQMRRFLYEAVSRRTRAMAKRRDADELAGAGFTMLAECVRLEAELLDPPFVPKREEV